LELEPREVSCLNSAWVRRKFEDLHPADPPTDPERPASPDPPRTNLTSMNKMDSPLRLVKRVLLKLSALHEKIEQVRPTDAGERN
jgi:hypothetical protein